eukprot:NODE_12841_length_1200_cov_5.785648.p1 GENE.NODE_12841_length_1200_cov_5.785648~~NODE_12841_length_1200_cov_5.785648.p1  ORF type:complete len:274 (+),score=55.11 NODE_12841_length_1200_cov_5.785648:246-1067(+)
MNTLNSDFTAQGLPALKIRVGVHTGDVLSGNLGSETKMKFGCMGDPMNCASRLEGACKVYGVGIICSGAICAALTPESGILCCKLDHVMLKGKLREAIDIYEVVGFKDAAMDGGLSRALDTLKSACDCTDICNVSTFGGILEDDNDLAAPTPRRWREPTDLRPSIFPPRFSPSPNVLPLPSPAPAAHMPLVEMQAVGKNLHECMSLYERALEAYQRAQFAEARMYASELLLLHPHYQPVQLLLSRISKYLTLPGQVVGLSEQELLEWSGTNFL